MLISDGLSRLVREPKTGHYVEGVADELLEEVVIASSIEASQLEDFQIHLKNGHCGSDRLRSLTGKPLAYCKDIVQACFACQTRKAVKEYKQILGTIPDEKRKNSAWCIDFVFHKDTKKKKYISILDRSTRFFMITKVDSRAHSGVKDSLEKEFLRMGKPETIIADREYISYELREFFAEHDIIFKPIPRESPFLNLVERYHQECKGIAERCHIPLDKAAGKLNYLPFASVPAGLKAKNICPAYLFYLNNKGLVKEVCDFLESESDRRRTRSVKLRGSNITRFQRVFEINDLVKFNLKDGLGFGRIIGKNGKIYDVKRVAGPNLIHSIHSQQLEKLLLSEKYLLAMLEK